MAIGFTKQNLISKLRGKKLPSNVGRKVILSSGGKGNSSGLAKNKIVDLLKYKSERQRREQYRKIGLTYDEKQKTEKIIAGGKTAAELKKEKEKYNILKKRSIGWARYNRDAEAQGGGMADKLIKGRMAVADDYPDKRKARADKAVDRVLTKEGRKVGFGDIGVEGRKYKQFAAADNYVEEGGGIEQKNIAGQRSSISQPKKVTGITGLGRKKELGGGISSGNKRTNIPLASNM